MRQTPLSFSSRHLKAWFILFPRVRRRSLIMAARDLARNPGFTCKDSREKPRIGGAPTRTVDPHRHCSLYLTQLQVDCSAHAPFDPYLWPLSNGKGSPTQIYISYSVKRIAYASLPWLGHVCARPFQAVLGLCSLNGLGWPTMGRLWGVGSYGSTRRRQCSNTSYTLKF
jgi:hypothetical protein